MDRANQTILGNCRFLGEDHFDALYKTFLEAFSDYVFPFALTETQFRNHINLNGVVLARTAGYFRAGQLIGFSLNGFGDWNGRSTVYDAGTGVIPSARRQGISEAIFNYMLPIFRDAGIEQCLLEVITSNTGAVKLYEKLGFEPVRDLALLQCDGDIQGRDGIAGVVIREISDAELEPLTNEWDGQPSWQNSKEALKRSSHVKQMLGAFVNGQCAGYIVFSGGFGRIAQLFVLPSWRNLGVATSLLREAKRRTATGYSLQVINIDKAIPGAVEFFIERGFYERLAQHEMLKIL